MKLTCPDPLPCPFCGCKDVYCGGGSATTVEVKCKHCRANIEMDFLMPWPKGVYLKGRSWDHNYGRLKFHVLKKVIKKWNRRSPHAAT